MRAHKKSASWVSLKWVKSNEHREKRKRREKVSVSNGQVNARTKIKCQYRLRPSYIYRVIYLTHDSYIETYLILFM